MNDQHINLTINRNVFHIIMLAVIIIILILPHVKNIIVPLGISLMLMVFFDPVVTWFESRGWGRVAAVITVLLISGVFFIFIVHFWGTRIVLELMAFRNLDQPDQFLAAVSQLPYAENNGAIDKFAREFHAIFIFLVHKSIDIFPAQVTLFILIVIIPVLTYLLLRDGYYLKKSVLQRLPNRYFEMMMEFFYRINQQLTSWLKRQLFIAFIVGGLTIVALYLLNVSHFLINGTMVGLAHLIPYYGPVIGAVVVVLITLIETGSWKLVLAIIIALATIKLLYNLVFAQLIKINSIFLHPLIILLLILTGSFLWGLIGMLIIVPITTVVAFVCREIYWSMKNYNIP